MTIFVRIEIMRNFSRFILQFVLLGAASLSANAQKARIAGLEQNEDYMQLLRQQLRLKSCEDSTVSLINNNRKLFENSTERDKIGQEIVRLESELFEVRNRMGKITAQVAAIEQEYIIEHMDDPAASAESGKGTTAHARTLFANSFFTDNLSKSDIALFTVTPKVEPEVSKINKRIADLYEQLTTVKRQYDGAGDQDVIDSLSTRAGELKEQIEQVDALMERLWLSIYNRKLDNYLVLMDKIGTIDRLKLEQLDQESRQVRRAEGLAGEQLAPLVATYPLQKKLALDYEITMAQALGLKQAEDSLRGESGRFSAEAVAKEMTYPDIPFAPRSLVVYGPIVKTEDTAQRNYTTVENIPVLHVPKKGIYYTVQLAIYTAPPKSVDAFKGMTPVMYQKMSNGQTRYLAGGFTAYSDALAAVNQMVRAGFRASLAAFSDGKATTAVKAKALEASARQAAEKANSDNGKGYNVQIIPAELRLPTAMRETITARAPGKTIVRNSSGSEVIYSVGSFASKTEADALAEALRSQPNVKIKVVAL